MCIEREPTITHVFQRGVRAARAIAYSDERIGFQRVLRLPAGAEAVFDCLRNIGCLQHWWPHLQRIQALPGGLRDAGDVALLTFRSGPGMMRVLRFQPHRRIVLAIAQDNRLVLLDLSVRTAADGVCVLTLQLESAKPASALRELRAMVWLRLLGTAAATSLQQHLLESSAQQTVAMLELLA